MDQPKMDLREGSRRKWLSNGATLNDSQLQAGALLRIADACEKMCLDREQLERGYAHMRRSRDQYRDLYDKERKRSSGLKGYIKRLQKIIAHFQQEEAP